uniref:C-type lectin n=1 Tax=Lutjanus sanguineus TaxID=264213 RepID=V5K4D4_9TELE|nr:C-type lectin [Lutjanus sanguineus]
MNPIKSKGTLGIRGHAVLCVLISLLVSAASSEDPEVIEAPKEDVAALKLRLHLLLNSYKEMCKQYSNLAPSCGAPEFNCTECPDDWLHVGDQCFHLSTDRHGFSTSEQKCEEKGGHLAILTTREQHEAVEQEGRRIGGTYTYYWIGLTDAEEEGTWKWVDNSTITTSFWNTEKGEPDNNVSGGKEGEDCAVVDSFTKTWYDVPCDFSYPRICQKDATVLP